MDQAETEVLEQETETEESETEEVATGEQSEETTEGEGSETEESEVTVTIGDEDPPASEEDESQAPTWVKELRKLNREKDRENRRLQQELDALKTGKTGDKPVELGEKPTLSDCNYDEDRFEKELDAWNERKREAEQKETKKRETAEAETKAWQGKLDAYGKAKAAMKVSDFEDAEEAVVSTFSVTQQGLLLKCPKDAEILIYALGKNPKRAKELAAIKDPVDFVYAAADIRRDLQVKPRKAVPLPEKTVRGSAPVSGNADSTLERLRTEAAKTGDYTKVRQHKQQMKAKQK